MSVEIADVADALVAYLAAQTFSAPYEKIRPEHLYDPEFKIDQLATVRTAVVSVDLGIDLADKDDDEEEITLGVAIQKHTDRSAREMNGLVKLAKEVIRKCRRAELESVGARATKAVFEPLYSPQKYREESIFWSGILVTFLVMEEGD